MLKMLKRIKMMFGGSLKNYKVGQTYYFNDPTPPGHPDNNYISDKVFDADVIIYNLGYVPKYRMFNVMVVPYRQKRDA